MHTAAAARSLALPDGVTVASIADLAAAGWSRDRVRNQVRARRWQRIGAAVVLHNGPPSTDELRSAALIVLGPRSALTSFTALSRWGLTGWERDGVHVLVPRGARVRRPDGLPLRIHYTDSPDTSSIVRIRRLHRPAQAAVRATADLPNPRSACGILAAVVQQRLAHPADLVAAVAEQPRLRHRRLLLATAHDIGQGAEALSEIDLGRLCRRAGLPQPERQVVRVGRSGRRRYLDGQWRRADGRRVVVEIDGALHLAVRQWWSDQLRQNEVVLSGDLVLRFPSAVVRCDPAAVAEQLGRALGMASRLRDSAARRAA